MKTPFTTLFICFLTAFTISLKSQSYAPVRMELSARMDAPSYHIESMGENGLILFYESNEINELQKRKWYFSLVDTTLTEKWVQTVPLTDVMAFHSSGKNNDKFVLLFTSDSKSKTQSVNYEIITYDNTQQQFNLIGGTIPEKAVIAGFASNGNTALMAINLPKLKSDFLFFDLKKGTIVSANNPIEGKVIINDLKPVNYGTLYVASIVQESDDNTLNNYFVVFDRFGNIIRKFIYNDPNKRYIHSFTFEYDPATDGIIVIGSFDNVDDKKEKLKQDEPYETEAAGLFFLKFSEKQAGQSNFIEFKEFRNIYSALSEEDLMEVRQQQARTKNEKPPKPNVAFMLFNQNLLRVDEKLIYVAEAFRPQYRLESRIEYDFYGRPIPYTYSVFEGYHFFTAIAGAFSREGEFAWSYSFEIPDMVSFYLQPHILLQPDSTDLVFCVINKGLLNSTVIGTDGEEIGSTEQMKIVSDFSNDRLLEEDYTSVKHWYGSNYLGTGYQKISNNKLRDNNPRTVFYLNKLSFY